MSKYDDAWFETLETALAQGRRLIVGGEQLDLALDHVVDLLVNASDLLERGSHASSAFFSITALEEIAKVNVGMYRTAAEALPRRKDVLFRHDKKLHIAVAPTIAMGGRLPDAIGEDRLRELMDMAAAGNLTRLREAAIYLDFRDGEITTPKDAIGPSLSRELLLLAVEAFDDGFVGLTSHTGDLEMTTNAIFAKWKGKP